MEKCLKCGRELTDNDLIYWKCTKCGKVFTASLLKLKNLQRQKKLHPGQALLKCPGCGYGIDDGKERMLYKCTGCGSTTGGNLDNFVGETEFIVSNDLQNKLASEKIITKCPECGTDLYHEMKFCPSCGRSVISNHKSKRKGHKKIIISISTFFTLCVLIFLIYLDVLHIPIGKKKNALEPNEQKEQLQQEVAQDNIITSECNHKYDDGIIIKKSTCVEEGEKEYTCIYCKKTKIEKIPVKKHKYKGKVTKKPTFQTEGIKTFTCKNCGDSYTESIPCRDDGVVVKVTDKSNMPKDIYNDRYYNQVFFVFDVTNNTNRTIRGVQGSLKIYDIFEKHIATSGCDFTGKDIPSNTTVTFDGLKIDINEFHDNEVELYTTDFQDLKFKYEITDIVYADEIDI